MCYSLGSRLFTVWNVCFTTCVWCKQFDQFVLQNCESRRRCMYKFLSLLFSKTFFIWYYNFSMCSTFFCFFFLFYNSLNKKINKVYCFVPVFIFYSWNIFTRNLWHAWLKFCWGKKYVIKLVLDFQCLLHVFWNFFSKAI